MSSGVRLGSFEEKVVLLEESECEEGKESAKKERAALGNVSMTWRTRGVRVEGHVAWQALTQRGSWEESEWSWEHVAVAEARAGPGRRVRMWVWIMSGWMAESALLSAALGSSPGVEVMGRCLLFF